MRGPTYTRSQIDTIKTMIKDGKSCKEIAAEIGRTSRAVECKVRSLGLRSYVTGVRTMTNEMAPEAPVAKKTLDDFSPREMIKYLYERGYRIVDGKLYQITKTEIKIKDIIS